MSFRVKGDRRAFSPGEVEELLKNSSLNSEKKVNDIAKKITNTPVKITNSPVNRRKLNPEPEFRSKARDSAKRDAETERNVEKIIQSVFEKNNESTGTEKK